MTIEIVTDKSFDPANTIIKVDGVEYKGIKGLQLTIAGNYNGGLTVEHSTGYLEAYKSEAPKE